MDDSCSIDKSFDHSITTDFQKMHLSYERHLVQCSSCNMYLDMPNHQFLQTFPQSNPDFTGFIYPQCMLKGEFIMKIEQLECQLRDMRAEKRQNELSEMENSFDCLLNSMNLGTASAPPNDHRQDPLISSANVTDPTVHLTQDKILPANV